MSSPSADFRDGGNELTSRMVPEDGCTLPDTGSGRACSELGCVERHRNGTQVGTEKPEPEWSSGCPQCSSRDGDSHVRGSACVCQRAGCLRGDICRMAAVL